MRHWVLAARPKTLPAALVPVWVGSVPVLFGDLPGVEFSWLVFFSTLSGAILIQIATNLFNDAIDAEKGADTEERVGPRRATASGLLSREAVLRGAVAVCLVAVVTAIPLILRHGWVPVAIGGTAFALAYAYTGGPFPLAYRGLGELFVILFFGFVAVMGTYYMQTGAWYGHPGWLAALQVGCYSTVLIAINNLRDHVQDRKVGKRTLAVRFGVTFGRWEIAFFCLLPIALWFGYGPLDSRAAGVMATSLIFAGIISRGVFLREPGPFYNKLLAIAALQLLQFGVWFTFCFDLGTRAR